MDQAPEIVRFHMHVKWAKCPGMSNFICMWNWQHAQKCQISYACEICKMPRNVKFHRHVKLAKCPEMSNSIGMWNWQNAQKCQISFAWTVVMKIIHILMLARFTWARNDHRKRGKCISRCISFHRIQITMPVVWRLGWQSHTFQLECSRFHEPEMRIPKNHRKWVRWT